MARSVTTDAEVAFGIEGVDQLISLLHERGYTAIGPTVRDGAITLDKIESAGDLPAGYTMKQSAGRCRLIRRQDHAVFGYAATAGSLKAYLHLPNVLLFRVTRNGGFEISRPARDPTRFAFFGVRACDLAALAIQDRVLLGDRYMDDLYQSRREGIFVVAAQCTESAPECFCKSVGSGPAVISGFDIVLTELVGAGTHVFVARAGSPSGREVLDALGAPTASPELSASAATAATQAERQTRRVDTKGLGASLYETFDNSLWDEAAAGCLACANCTQVCPTCFCTSVEDTGNIQQTKAERWRHWDSCFTEGFSYIHGGSIRLSVKSRYRQRIIHKFAAWQEQFGMPGCTGCGRCTTWCPAGIDVVEQIAAARARLAAMRLEEAANGSRSDTKVSTPPIC